MTDPKANQSVRTDSERGLENRGRALTQNTHFSDLAHASCSASSGFGPDLSQPLPFQLSATEESDRVSVLAGVGCPLLARGARYAANVGKRTRWGRPNWHEREGSAQRRRRYEQRNGDFNAPRAACPPGCGRSPEVAQRYHAPQLPRRLAHAWRAGDASREDPNGEPRGDEVLSRAWSACVPGAHLAARHRCDIRARSRPRRQRTPYIGLTESTCDGEQRTR